MFKKNISLVIFTLAIVLTTNAQTAWGVKGSLIYNSNGELVDEVKEVIDSKGKGETGFNIGVYGNLELGPIYIGPELVYTKTSSEYVINPENGSTESYKMSSIDLPVLVGIRIIGPLNLVAGPAFKFITSNEINGQKSEDLDKNVTVGLNIGAAVQLGRFGIDLIYDRGFSSNEASFIGSNVDISSFTLDTRQEQIKVGISYRLSDKKK